MPSRQRVQDLIRYIEEGRILDAIEEFYTDDVLMQDNLHPPTLGKPANRRREQAWSDSVAQVHERRAASFVVEGDHVAIEWVFDFIKFDGTHVHMEEVAYQTWRDDHIERERFYYDSAAVLVAP